jgi:hypothetical protein
MINMRERILIRTAITMEHTIKLLLLLRMITNSIANLTITTIIKSKIIMELEQQEVNLLKTTINTKNLHPRIMILMLMEQLILTVNRTHIVTIIMTIIRILMIITQLSLTSSNQLRLNQ